MHRVTLSVAVFIAGSSCDLGRRIREENSVTEEIAAFSTP
jgi:hypothetical protein